MQCRRREWALLPSDQDDLILLWPLTGAADVVGAIHKGLIGISFSENLSHPREHVVLRNVQKTFVAASR
jgi:hypothetical protein